jgi:hypothetical protein
MRAADKPASMNNSDRSTYNLLTNQILQMYKAGASYAARGACYFVAWELYVTVSESR